MGNMSGRRYRRVDLTGAGSVHSFPAFSLNEDIEYSPEIPYSIVLQKYVERGNITLHFADTLEIILIKGCVGDIFVAGRRVALDGSPRVIVVLPGTLHSGAFTASGEAKLLNLKISLENMRRYIDIEGILAAGGRSVYQLSLSRPDYGALYAALMRTAAEDENLFARTRGMLDVYELLLLGIPERLADEAAPPNNLESLNKLVRWTQEHFRERISVEQAASVMGLSKCYFCKYFKAQTNQTYLSFLTQVRIRQAIRLLGEGKNAAECCWECGFDSVPYFVQLFKRTTGRTTREFKKIYLGE